MPKILSNGFTSRKSNNEVSIIQNRTKAVVNDYISNLFTVRSRVLERLLSDDRDIDKELKYPITISPADYDFLFQRSDIAEKVVSVYPDDSWAVDPLVFENENVKKTEFEKEWNDLVDDLDLYHYLHRADVLSGVGHFGIILLGLDDGRDFKDPAPGIKPDGTMSKKRPKAKLLYIRPFPENMVEISQYEKDPSNQRYRLPTEYQIRFIEEGSDKNPDGTSLTVHWSRIIHLADNRGSSEVFGKPRMKPVYNRLLDLRKILGGSAEMFWKGAFPGYSFEVNPEYAAAIGLDENSEATKAFKEGMRAEFKAYSDGLQRYLASIGVSAKSLAPQVATPDKHIMSQLRVIAATIGQPFRIFMGSEQGSLASSQDTRTWNRKLSKRQRRYLTPKVLKVFIVRLMYLGVLPVIEHPRIKWPDLDTITEQDRADVADKITTALQKFVTGKIEKMMPLFDYLTLVIQLSPEKAKQIVDAARKQKDAEDDSKNSMITVDALNPTDELGGGGDNMPVGKPAGGQTPKSSSTDRTRGGGGASGNT